MKRLTVAMIRAICLAALLANVLVPVPAQARSFAPAEEGARLGAAGSVPRRLAPQAAVYYQPPNLPQPRPTTQEGDEPQPKVPPRAEAGEIEFLLSASPAVLKPGESAVLRVTLRNHSEDDLFLLDFKDQLEGDLEYVPNSKSPVSFNKRKNEVTYTLPRLAAGEEFSFEYTLRIAKNGSAYARGEVWLHAVELKEKLGSLALKAQATLGFDLEAGLEGGHLSLIDPDGAWNDAGEVSVYVPKEAAQPNTLLVVAPTRIQGKGPAMQFNLEMARSGSIARQAGGLPAEQQAAIQGQGLAAFKSPVYLQVNLDSVADLRHIPAGQEPFVATYDEKNQVWVKVPILEADLQANTVTVETTHFSTWGAGLGESLPQNGAGALLFDQPYTSLFTGAAQYSLAIETPPGRAGMAPQVSLSYSSATLDGVLGDVQGSPVGAGWNMDDIEVVRRITTNEDGYGYINHFALTLNGALYDLTEDTVNTGRYYTLHDAFLYIERHNYAFGNMKDGDLFPPNTSGEWWEVITQDGTHYRLGWNPDAEQLAPMIGYACSAGGLGCLTPDGPYATLGYAGVAEDLVVRRWRVDRITDTHGNFITYSYTESQPDPSTWVPAYDRESYLGDISYTGFEHPGGQGQYDLEPGYQVHFEYGERTGDIPDAFNIWDYVDFLFLDRIEICLGMCGEAGSTLVRTYDLDYTVEEAPNENGTLTLSGLEINGGGYQENGQAVPFVETPSMTFTYENKPNRQVIGSIMKEFSYPRLVSIQNGFGGKIAYTYETDGRDMYSWYNYRVIEVEVESEAGDTAALYTYTYEDPVYKEPGYSGWGIGPDDGSLVGYTTVSEEQLDFNDNNAVLSHTRHTFGTEEPDIGHEFLTEWLAGEEVLRKTAYTYVTDSSQAPFPGWYFRYLAQTANYERSGASLPLISKSASTRDPGTGNLLVQADYIGSSLYRKAYYEYLTNPDPDIYLMDKASRVLLVNASNQVVADTRYHYDNRIGLAPDKGDLTLVQNLTGSGSQTVDASSSYDVYGNVTSTRNHTSYGAVNAPSGAYSTTSTEYDDSLWTYPLSVTDPLGQVSTTEYLFGLGLPYAATDPNGWATATGYDGLGRTLSVTPPGLGQEGVWYTYPTPLDGQVAAPYAVEMQILDSAAGVYRSVWGVYDGLGRMLQTQVYDADQGQLLVTDTQFNAQGLAYRQSPPYYESGVGGAMQDSAAAGEYTQSEYDSFGRLTELSQPAYNFSPIEPVYNITQTSYSGLATTVIDPNGNRVSRTTDGLGRMKYVLEYQDAPGIYATTQYFYDAADRLIQVTDAEGNYTTIQYDWLGRKTGMDDMDMGVWTYAYDPPGNLLLQTDARGQSLAFQYDDLNRLVEKRDASQEIVLSTYTYGAAQGVIGFRTAMNDQGGSTTWSYADFGRTVTETRAAGSMVTASDWLGRPLQATYPGGETLTYSYDALGRPEQLASDQTPGAPLAGLSYNQLGQVTTQALGNNLAVSNTYESYTHRLSNRQALAGQTSLLDMDYTYEANGNIASITDNALGETHVYQYDSLNRLTLAEATQSGSYVYRQQFVYDKIGNIQGADDWDVISYPNPITKTEPEPQKGAHLASLSMPWPFFQLEQTETPTPTPTPTNTLIPTNTGAPTYTVSPTETSATSTPTKTPTASRTPTTTPSMEQSLAAYWDFDSVVGNAVQDVAPQDTYNNVATLVNGAAIIPAGADGDALRLDGEDDYASVPYQAELNSSESFTLSAWVNPAAVITDRIQYIVHKGGLVAEDYGFITTSNNGTATPTPDGTATPPVYIPSNGGLAFVVGDLTPDRVLGPVLPADTWTLVTGVYDKPAKKLHLYINGVLVATQEVTGAVSISGGGLYFSAAAHLFDGSLDEVRFYKRALSAAEVQQLMGEFPTPTPPASQTPTPATITATPTSTPIPVGAYPWGNGADGDLTVAAEDAFNIHTDGSNGRNCADAVAFSVVSLGSTAALLNASATDCLSPNDEVLLAHLNGESLMADNIGNYEFLRVASVDTSTVTFSTPKTKWYGNDYRSDAGIGIQTGQNRVMLMRVPNYEDVAVNGTLTGEAFDNLKYGLLAFRASGTLSGSGTIHMDEKGFKGTAVVGDLRGYGAGGNGGNGSGGGGGYGTPGAQGDGEHGGAGGQAYGAPQLETLFFGSGGGAGYNQYGGMRGGDGGGVIFVAGQTINFSGELSAQGMDGPGTTLKGGGGAGGSIRIQGYDVSLNTIEATGGQVAGENGYGGVGRVALYYQNSKAYTSSAPAAFEGLLGQAPTLTPSPTSISLTPAPAWGSGLDGDLTVAAGQTWDLHTEIRNWRTCADGVSYKVIDLGDNWAKLSEAPGAGCLEIGDEVLLNHLYGSGPNIGQHEFLRVGQVSEDIVYFTTPKANFYGDEADSDVGVSSDTQKVALYRVPNYNDVAIDGTLTGQAFDNQKNGLLVFRVAGTLSGSGKIHMDEKGYKGNAVVGDIRGYGAGGNGGSGSGGNGGGGGYGTPGAQGAGAQGGAGGQAYGIPQMEAPFFGSGGGAGYNRYGGMRGSDGGGAIFIAGQTIDFSGELSALGMNSLGTTLKGGAGSGGSILVQGQDVSLYIATVNGGSYSESFGKGGKGRIAVYYQDTFSSNFPPDYLQKADTPDTISNSDFETGDLSQWDSALTDDGDLSASGDDAYWGRYALQAALDDANDLYVQDDSPEDEARYRARFYLHPGDLGLEAGETLDLLAGYDGATQVLRVQMRQYGSLYQVRAGLLDDAAAWSDTAWHITQDSWTALEIDWQARAGEGSVSLYIGGILRESLTQVDNDTRALTQARLGAMQIGTGASGSLYLDDFDARRFSSIGLLPDPGFGPASGAPGLLTNLVGWWSLDEESGLRADAHGDNHLGDYNTVEDIAGLQGQAADFEMNNHEYLYHDDAPDFDLSDVEWSIAAWVKLEGQVVGSVHSILRKFDAGGSQKEYLLAVSGTDRKARIYVSGNGATGANLASSVVLAPPAQQKWQFIVAWYDGSNLYIQVDDNPVDTLAYTAGVYDGNSMFLVGGDPYDGQRFDGAIDEVALYKRVLSDEERAWLYNAGAGRSYAELLGEQPASEGWLQRGYAYEGQQPHAVTSVSHSGGTDTYEYDQNGNMTCRTEQGVAYQQTYNAENRIASIRELAEGDCETPVRIATQWDYSYDGDGMRTATLTTPYDENGNPQTASLTTYYFGGAYEVTDGAVKKYYAFGGGTVAMRDGNGLQYFLTDHLGSVLAVTDASGTLISEQRYLPFGQVRDDVGTITQTDFGYTGQRGLPGTGLMDYRARFYAPALGRFTQPDSIVPGTENPQSLNRYSYVSNSPITRIDPSGHDDSDYRDRMNRLRKAYGDKLWFQYRRAYHRGIVIVIRNMDPLSDRSDVAAAIAVQSRYYSFLDNHGFAWLGVESLGIAQVTDEQMKIYQEAGLSCSNQEKKSCAIAAMEMRIDLVLEQCKGCSAEDRLIVAALAQNGGLTAIEMKKTVLASWRKDGTIDWNGYFEERDYGSTWEIIRATGHQSYDTRYMIHMYTSDLLTLHNLGWELPYGLTVDQVKQVQEEYTHANLPKGGG